MQQYFGPRQTNRRASLKSYATVFLLILVFFGGWYAGQGRTSNNAGTSGVMRVLNTSGQPKDTGSDVDFNLFWQVWNDIKANYVKQPVNETDLFYGAMRGMIGALDDPYSDFYNPELAAQFNEELSGSFSGIGVEIGKRSGLVVIITPLADSPGERAGLKPGDLVLAIDKTETTDMPLDQAVTLIRGKEGTTVVLTVLSKGGSEPKDVSVVRQKIEHTGLRWEVRGNLAYVKLSTFDEETETLLNKFIREYEARGDLKGIVLDMRNNPGGFLEMAIEAASAWVEDGVVVRERDRDGNERLHNARGRARLAGVPTVVLVNEGSASAAEILAGALQDYGAATIIGKTTFGKGSVQKYEGLKDGSSFRLTVARWFTPKERAIDEVGIKPDIEVDLTEEDFNQEKDPQLEAAIRALTK
ncbi:MAG: S41 family peptidase [Parcubacteria group bacterium]|nr:S41 family peptidase [Parcubacteria group bacterium]